MGKKRKNHDKSNKDISWPERYKDSKIHITTVKEEDESKKGIITELIDEKIEKDWKKWEKETLNEE